MQKNERKSNSFDMLPKIPRGFHIEIDKIIGGISISVSDVVSIPDFSQTSAILKVRRGKIKISGESLAVAVYENRIVEICGNISGMEFLC